MELAVHMKNTKTGEERIKKTIGKSASLSDWSCKDFHYGSDWMWTGTEPWKNVCDSVEHIGRGYYRKRPKNTEDAFVEIEEVGNIKVYAAINEDKSVTIKCFEDSKCVVEEVYYRSRHIKDAIETLFRTTMDTFTEKWLKEYLKTALVKVSENEYKAANTADVFKRIGDTRFFKHYVEERSNTES